MEPKLKFMPFAFLLFLPLLSHAQEVQGKDSTALSLVPASDVRADVEKKNAVPQAPLSKEEAPPKYIYDNEKRQLVVNKEAAPVIQEMVSPETYDLPMMLKTTEMPATGMPVHTVEMPSWHADLPKPKVPEFMKYRVETAN